MCSTARPAGTCAATPSSPWSPPISVPAPNGPRIPRCAPRCAAACRSRTATIRWRSSTSTPPAIGCGSTTPCPVRGRHRSARSTSHAASCRTSGPTTHPSPPRPTLAPGASATRLPLVSTTSRARSPTCGRGEVGPAGRVAGPLRRVSGRHGPLVEPHVPEVGEVLAIDGRVDDAQHCLVVVVEGVIGDVRTTGDGHVLVPLAVEPTLHDQVLRVDHVLFGIVLEEAELHARVREKDVVDTEVELGVRDLDNAPLIGEFGQLLGHFRSPEVILCSPHDRVPPSITRRLVPRADDRIQLVQKRRSEEHTSELQSRGHLVFRPLLEKKNEHIPHQRTTR